MSTELTPRQIAGKANRAKRKGITEEGREALRAAALKNRPWGRATGPKTDEGKQRSSLNAMRHGGRTFDALPDDVKKFMAELRMAEKGAGPLPLTVRPLTDFICRLEEVGLPLLVERLKALRSRYGDLCIREHLRSPNFRRYVSRMGLTLD